MTEQTLTVGRWRGPYRPRGRGPRPVAAALCALVIGNAGAVLWLWLQGGAVRLATVSPGGLLISSGRFAALIGTYLVLIQVVMMTRVPWLERVVGFDRLTVWHRRNGMLAVGLVLLHAPLTVVGRALILHKSLGGEIGSLYGTRPGLVTGTVGAGVLILVVLSSLLIVRRKLRYETWYLVHLLVYAGVLLAYFHQVQTGNEFAAHPVQRGYWDALYILVALLLLRYRVLAPVLRFWRHRLHVVEVRRESARIVSIYMEGRQLERLGGRGGQFFLWRFLTKSRWWQAHPFSLSAAPDGSTLRITVKDVGDFTKLIGEIKPGTRVLADGPYGRTFAPVAGGRAVALIAGGIGITPLRAMLDELIARDVPVTLIHRVMEEEELVLRSELAGYERDGRLVVINVVGDRFAPGAESLLSGEHLLELIPDLPDREIFLCGPPGMMRHVHGCLAALRIPARQVHSERFALAAERTRIPSRRPGG
jgi:predicted ferric reductase